MDRITIFDRAALARARARATRIGAEHFLLDHAGRDLAERIADVPRTFHRLLEIVPREAVVGPRLFAEAKVRAAVLGLAGPACPPCEWPAVRLDEEWLPFAPGSFDLVVAPLTLHAVNDLPGALVQIRRAMTPDGLFLAALPGGESLSELRHALAAAEAELAGGAAPRVMPFADVREYGDLVRRAGYALPVADTDRLVVRYADPIALMRDLRAMGETNILAERSRRPLARAVLTRMAEIYAERFSDRDGRVRATFDIVTMTGWCPAAGQPQPLRPGSATARLADALGTAELKAGDRARPWRRGK